MSVFDVLNQDIDKMQRVTYPCREITLPALSTHPPLSIAAKYWHRELRMHLCALIRLPATSTTTSGLISSRNIRRRSWPSRIAASSPWPWHDTSVSDVLMSETYLTSFSLEHVVAHTEKLHTWHSFHCITFTA